MTDFSLCKAHSTEAGGLLRGINKVNWVTTYAAVHICLLCYVVDLCYGVGLIRILVWHKVGPDYSCGYWSPPPTPPPLPIFPTDLLCVYTTNPKLEKLKNQQIQLFSWYLYICSLRAIELSYLQCKTRVVTIESGESIMMD